MHENRLNIIKSSLFFICHWTKNLQIEVAKRLVKKILVPNEKALQAFGRERIYIIKSGRLEIYTNNCMGFKRQFKKLLKTIEKKPGVDIFDNIYGYSAVIASKPVKLEAVSKDFTCVYSIDRNSFMECVH
jgi:flavorubredoxin